MKVKQTNNLSIHEYLDTLSILNDNTMPEWKKNLNILAIHMGKTYEDLLKMTPAEISDCTSKVKLNHKLLDKFHLNCPKHIRTQLYDYEIDYNLEHMNMAQYLDFQSYIAEDNSINNVHKVLSVVLIPKDHNYNEGYVMQEVQDDIYEHLTIKTANDISFFLKKHSLILIKSKLLYYKLMMWVLKMTSNRQDIEKIIVQMKALNEMIEALYSIDG